MTGPDRGRLWLEHFARQGHDPRPLAAGSEGTVYDLGRGLIGKAWRERGVADLRLMQEFYADVAAAGLPFATPEIISVQLVAGTAVTCERKLPGRPLQDSLADADAEISPAAASGVTGILRALATVPATPSMRHLPVLREDRALRAGPDAFPAALARLLERRARQHGPVISGRLPGFARLLGALTERVAAIGAVPDTVIHGDLFGGNILVDDRQRTLAVIDFGFLTTAGDPRLDAAITAAIMNMYGPHAARITRDLTARLARDLGYPAPILLVYQAAYAVATSNAFTADGSDGHFAWCLAQLRRPDIRAALGLPARH